MIKQTSVRDLLCNPSLLLAFGLGAGLTPKAPGTAGTLVGAILYFSVLKQLSLGAYLIVVLVILSFGIWLCGYAAKKLGVDDHPGIVWDEITGYLLAMIAAPEGDMLYPVLGFLLFRWLDIQKPGPIGTLDRAVGGGLGIMLDDVLAGITVFGMLQLLVLLMPVRLF